MKERIICFLLASAIIASCSKGGLDPDRPGPETKPEAPADEQLIYPAPQNRQFRKIAYFPSYRNVGASYVPDFIYESIDICYYAFATINSDYSASVESPTTLQALVSRAHGMGKKVVISFAGNSSIYGNMVASRAGRLKFINSIMEIVNRYSLDGVDNDWEYPSTKNGSAAGNVQLMREFSNILHAPDCGKLLTMAITPGKYAGSYRDAIVDELFDCVDWFNVMTYDDYSTDTPGINHATMELVQTAFNYYVTSRKLPCSKFLVGIPCYGRGSGITQSGTVLSYAAILEQGGNPDEDSALVEVSGSSYSGRYTIYYNGRNTVRKKVRFAKENNLGGYFFWEQGEDSYDGRSLIKCAFQEEQGK